jgi:hypothetical protein
MSASDEGRVEVVRFLLRHPIAKTTLNHCARGGHTALCLACYSGHAGVVRVLLEIGADPTIPTQEGITPMDAAKEEHEYHFYTEGRLECVAELEVRVPLVLSLLSEQVCCDQAAEAWGVILGMMAGGGARVPAVEGPRGGRPAGERRGGGAKGARGLGGEADEDAGGLCSARAEGGPVPGADGVYGVRGRGRGGGYWGSPDHAIPCRRSRYVKGTGQKRPGGWGAWEQAAGCPSKQRSEGGVGETRT